jgi:hypothetical protein
MCNSSYMADTFSFETILGDFESKLWRFHFIVPDPIALSLIQEDNKRVICCLAGHTSFQAALMKSKSYWFILLNKKLKDKLNLNVGQKLEVILEKDNSKYGHEMPEELQVLLDQDEEGNKHFQDLTLGKQRSLIYIVNQVKNSNSRINRSLGIITHLKETNGKLDFKAMMEKIKYYTNLPQTF